MTTSTSTAPPIWPGTWSLVLGILALVFSFVPFFAIPAGIVAIIFGCLSLKSATRGQGIAGLVTAGIGLFVSLLITIGIVILFMIGVNQGVKEGIQESRSSSITSTPVALQVTDLPADVKGDLAQDYLFYRFGQRIFQPNFFLDIDTQGDRQGLLQLETSAGDFAVVAMYNDQSLQSGAMVIDTALFTADTNFDPQLSTVQLATPSDLLLTQTQDIVDLFAPYLSGYDFDQLDVQEVLFTSNPDSPFRSFGNEYAIRDDGFSQIKVSLFDQTGNNLVSIFLIFEEDDLRGAGFAPASTTF